MAIDKAVRHTINIVAFCGFCRQTDSLVYVDIDTRIRGSGLGQ